MDQQEAMKSIYDLKPLEGISAKEMGIGQAFSVLRIPGGWLFVFPTYGCFVPFNNEFEMGGLGSAKVAVPKQVKKAAEKIIKKKADRKSK
jgi:hypothetical protein